MALERRKFLTEKYPDLAGSKPVERAVRSKIRDGEPGAATREGRVGAYMDRLEHISRDERGFELLKRKVLDRFAIHTGDEVMLGKIAEGLYESEKRLAIEQGRGADVAQFESAHDVIGHYKPLIREKAEIQRKTLSSWLDYLQENDAMQPIEFRYFVARNLEKMGMLDKEKLDYSKRAATTVAPFPELNSEALGWVYKRLEEGTVPDDVPEDKREAVERAIKSKDFQKLYAFAQVETIGNLNRTSLEGQWRTYDQDSDYHVLENDLHGKGTGWCTAEGSAQSQLEGGDFYVYYTKGDDGRYTEPRVAIRMEGDHVGEVRGVNQHQELEPELVDVAQAQYHALPGGESYDKKAHDMKEMTRLVKKQEQKEAFTKGELRFLHELEVPIEGFGYERDPRIEEVRSQRDVEADMPILFECASEQIAHSPDEINEGTKAYVGALTPGIFGKLANIEHVYTSFPGGTIRFDSLEIGGKSERRLERELQEGGINVSGPTRDMMQYPDFTTLKNPEEVRLVRLCVEDLGFPDGALTGEIYARAEELGLELCPAEVGPRYRLKYTEQPLGELLVVGMKQMSGPDGSPRVFDLVHDVDGLWLSDHWADPGRRWHPGLEFVFRFRASRLET